MSLQDVHAGPPNWSISFLGWKESHGCTGNGLLIGLAQVPQGFAGGSLICIGKPKPGHSYTPCFSYVKEVFTFPDMYGDFTPFGFMLYVFSTFIFRVILDSKPLHGGIQELRKAFNT
jgi:hypothetical protein